MEVLEWHLPSRHRDLTLQFLAGEKNRNLPYLTWAFTIRRRFYQHLTRERG